MYNNGANYKVADALAVASQATVYTNSFPTKWLENFGVWLLASSASSTPKIQIQLEQSYLPPTPEGSQDNNWVIGDGVADVYPALNDEVAHIKQIAAVTMQYSRFKITGLATNPSDTLLTIVACLQEPI